MMLKRIICFPNGSQKTLALPRNDLLAMLSFHMICGYESNGREQPSAFIIEYHFLSFKYVLNLYLYSVSFGSNGLKFDSR